MKENDTVTLVELPEGEFCHSGNCSDCYSWDPRHRDAKQGQGYCSHYGHFYYPSERQGCLSHSR